MDKTLQNSIKVSVIIPVFNTENYLKKCLDSIVNQTLKDIEIICINDGSTDSSLAILNEYSKKDKRIKIIDQENKKQGAARNVGIKAAKGEYLGFVDSDDWLDLDYFEKLYNAAKKYNSDIALATNVRIGGKKTKKRLNITDEKYYTDFQDKIDVCNQWKNPCPTNKIYKNSLLNGKNIFFPEKVYCEDKLFTIQTIYYANAIVSVPDINYYYFRNPSSTVNTKKIQHTKKLLEDKKKANQDVINFLKEKNANIRDKDFWAVLEEKKFSGLTLYKTKISLKTKKYLLFGIIPIFYKKA